MITQNFVSGAELHANTLTSNTVLPITIHEQIAFTLSQIPDGTRDLFRERFDQGIGMPKKDVADYIELQGISVPKRFTTFEDAVASGKSFIVRSEDPREYAGRSGIYSSHLFRRRSQEIDSFIPVDMFAGYIREALYAYQQNPLDLILPSTWDETLRITPEIMSKNAEADWTKDMYIFLFKSLKKGLDNNRELTISLKDRSNIDAALEQGKDTKNVDYIDVGEYILSPGWTVEDIFATFWSRSNRDKLQVFYTQKLDSTLSTDLQEISNDMGWDQVKKELLKYESSKHEQEIEGLDYSFWEYIPGDNLAVCRDTVYPNVYYIYETKEKASHVCHLYNAPRYTCKRVEMKEGTPDGHNYHDIITAYEKIAGLPVFDNKNCPIVELQKNKDKNLYFLQTLPTQSQQEPWKIDRDLENGEIKAGFVRGATSPEGITVQISKYDDMDNQNNPDGGKKGFSIDTMHLKIIAENSHHNLNYLESAVQDSQLGVIVFDNTHCSRYRIFHGPAMMRWVVGDHGGRSVMHKPKVSVLLGETDYERLRLNDRNSSLIRVISDGTICYLKKLS